MSDSDFDPDCTPKKKKKQQYNQIYLKKWEEIYEWLAPGPTESRAFCNFCRKDFSISHGGQYDIKQHSKYKTHQNNEKRDKGGKKLSNFFVNTNIKPEYDAVAASEAALIYHCIKHNQTYASLDCGNKLTSTLFSDSTTAKKLSCGRTKSEAIVKNVFAPKSASKFLEFFNTPESSNFFSIATDASNKGNRKMFPICIKYFNPNKGVENKLLNFIECPDETAVSISKMLLQNLNQYSLDIKYLSAYSADNANVNFGKKHSVYQILKEQNVNLEKANCSNHILHNAMKFAADKLDVDIENIVLKIYNHFSVSAKRRENLKSFFEIVELEWAEILRHVPTRWLSLTSAVNRLIENWSALSSYFKSIDECPKFFANIFLKENDDQENITLLYLHFFANIGQQLDITAKNLEKQDISIFESAKSMSCLRNKIEQRIADKYFGNSVKQTLKLLPVRLQLKISNELCDFYNNVLNYLDRRYDFDNNKYLKLRNISLCEAVNYEDFENAVELFHLENIINLDNLYEEFSEIRSILIECAKLEENDVSKWLFFFSKVPAKSVPNILKIVGFFYSIPGSNAFVERIFSLMHNKWTDVRNRSSPDLIKAELQTVVNFDMSCKDFFLNVQKDHNLLNDVKSAAKYI